jgi:chromatin structure-remodeling complex subunit RSC9
MPTEGEARPCAHAVAITDSNRHRTPFELEPRVSGRPIDLYVLYNAVVSRGGYDAVCNERLAWRKVGGIFHLPSLNAAAHAFALKSVYYYNLA